MNSQGVLPLSVLSLRGQGVGEQERVLVLPQRVSRSAMGGPQRCVLDGAVHPLDLPTGPRTAVPGKPGAQCRWPRRCGGSRALPQFRNKLIKGWSVMASGVPSPDPSFSQVKSLGSWGFPDGHDAGFARIVRVQRPDDVPESDLFRVGPARYPASTYVLSGCPVIVD